MRQTPARVQRPTARPAVPAEHPTTPADRPVGATKVRGADETALRALDDVTV